MSYVKVIGNLKTIASQWFVQVTDIVTSIAENSNSASNSKVPSERAVREAISDAVTDAIEGDLYEADEETITLSSDRKFSVKNGGIGYNQVNTRLQEAISSAEDSVQIGDSISALTEDDSHQTVTSAQKSTWNAKQDALTADTDYLTPSTAASTYQPIGDYAPLDETSKVPAANLPSYVDDVLEGYLFNGSFYTDSTHTTLITAESGKIYVDLGDNKTYRYSGSQFTEISASLAIGITAGTAYDGAAGAQNAAKIVEHTTAIAANAANITALQSSKISTNALSSCIDIKIATPTTEETAAGLSAGDLYFVFSNEQQPSA